MSTAHSPLADWLLPDRLARTVCEVDPRPHSRFAVAVVLEVLGHTDRTAREAGWPDLFALARDVYERVELVSAASRRADREVPAEPESPLLRDSLASGLTQQAVWLVMVAVTLVWGLSVWAAQRLPASLAEALLAGIVGSLILSGGFQYALTRRLVFHVAQRDHLQARAFVSRALRVGGLALGGAGALVALGVWAGSHHDVVAAALAGSYFVLHGNYRLAVTPLQALHDVAGLVVSTGGAVAMLVLLYRGLVAAGVGIPVAVATSQLAVLLLLWVACWARARWLLEPLVAVGVLPGPRGSARPALAARGAVLVWDAGPWFALGVLYYVVFFGARPVAGLLPPDQQLVYAGGMDLGLLAMIPSTLGASWLLRSFTRGVREQLRASSVDRTEALREEALGRFARALGRSRLSGALCALILLLGLEAVASRVAIDPGLLGVLRLSLAGTALVISPFSLAFGLLVSLGVLRDALAVLVLGTLLHVGLALLAVPVGSGPALVLAFLVSAAVMAEVAAWRARRAVCRIDRHYYAMF